LLGVSVCLAFAVRWLFFSISTWLWNFASKTDLADVVPWAHWAMGDRDGAEAYGLLGAVALQGLGTVLGMALLARLRPRWRAGVVAALLATAIALAWKLPPHPPWTEVYRFSTDAYRFVAGILVATWLVGWLGRRTRARVPTLLAVLLFPLCFVPIGYSSLADLICLLAPALRLQHGIRLSEVYLQYDLLPSLLARAWTAIGGSAPAFSSVIVPATFYGLFLGSYAIARRLLRPGLAAPLLASLILVRYYGIPGDFCPQVAPLRLDLWVLPLGLVLAVGLRHWSVGLLLGALCFFSRSMGILQLGAYGLAVAVNFFAQRRAPGASATPFFRALLDLVIGTKAVWGIVLLWLLAVRFAFGSFGSDAVAIYHQLGVGMMRIDPTSFYWWLLPLTGGVGWLAFSRRASLPSGVGEASIFAVTLTVSSSIYFFGRSHELNLLNTSAPYLFCVFLGLSLAWPIASDPKAVRWAFRAAPWLMVATCAYFYSAMGLGRMAGQLTEVTTQAPLLQATSAAPVPTIDCAEIRRAAPDDQVIFFSSNDYWYYEHCHLVPRGYFQPLYLAILTKPLAADLSKWIRRGYKLAVPRGGQGEFVAGSFAQFVPDLPPLDVVGTTNFEVYHLRP